MLPYASWAVTVMLKAIPAICGLPTGAIIKRFKAAAVTVNELLVPNLLAPDVERVIPAPDLVMATLPVQMPLVNAAVLVGLIVPVESLRLFMPL